MIAQTRRAVSSIREPRRRLSADLQHGLRRIVGYALASPLEYHLLLARDLGYMNDGAWDSATLEPSEIRGMLNGLAAHLATTTCDITPSAAQHSVT